MEIYTGVEFLGHIVILVFVFLKKFLKKFHSVFHSGCTDLHFYQQETYYSYKSPFFSKFSPTFTICVLFDDSHSDSQIAA